MIHIRSDDQLKHAIETNNSVGRRKFEVEVKFELELTFLIQY